MATLQKPLERFNFCFLEELSIHWNISVNNEYFLSIKFGNKLFFDQTWRNLILICTFFSLKMCTINAIGCTFVHLSFQSHKIAINSIRYCFCLHTSGLCFMLDYSWVCLAIKSCIFWALVLVEVSVLWIWLFLSVQSIRLQYKISELAHQVDFLLDIENHKVRKVLDLDFWKKARAGLEESKMSQKWPKNELFLGFDKNLVHSHVLFYFSMSLLIFYKYLMFEKNLVLELWSKRSRPIRMQDSLTYNFFFRD